MDDVYKGVMMYFVLQGFVIELSVRHHGWIILVITYSLLTVTTGQSSLNRLNLGASMTRLGSTHVVTSSLSYNFVLHVPDKNTSRHVTSIPRCEGWLPSYNNGATGTKCATGIRQIRDALQVYRDNTYIQEVLSPPARSSSCETGMHS